MVRDDAWLPLVSLDFAVLLTYNQFSGIGVIE